MKFQRLVNDGTALEVSILALLNVAGAGAGLAALVHPVTSNEPEGLIGAATALGLAIAVGLMLLGPRVPRWLLHAVMVSDVAIASVMVSAAVTPRGTMVAALIYVWAGIYLALFFSPKVVRGYTTFITVAYGLALIFARTPTDVTIWVLVSATIWVEVLVLSSLSERLRQQAHSDGLTGLLNRNGFRDAALRHRAISIRSGAPLALAAIDLDGFKTVNDTGGHAAGDLLLSEIAASWRQALRPGDLLGRHGRDEFVLLLPATTPREAEDVLARLALAHPTLWTSGIVAWEPSEPLEGCIARADELLYAAKPGRGVARAAVALDLA